MPQGITNTLLGLQPRLQLYRRRPTIIQASLSQDSEASFLYKKHSYMERSDVISFIISQITLFALSVPIPTIQSVDRSYQDICGRSFEAYDPFAYLAYKVLKGGYSFVVKETAANILRYVAVDVNRFSAQRLISDSKDVGIEPPLEDILDS